jgi:death-on-curing protein
MYEEPNNLINEGSLKWALYVIQNPFFYGVNRYPTISHKAAILMWSIIDGHVFADGNKRTGIASTHVFLSRNNYSILSDIHELKELALYIANKSISGATYEDIVQWLKEHIIEQ